MANSKRHELLIKETGRSNSTQDGKRIFEVLLQLDGKLLSPNRWLEDPFTTEYHEQIHTALAELVVQKEDSQAAADLACQRIEFYRTELFASLDLSRLMTHRLISVEVHECCQGLTAPSHKDSIHRLQWEQLEHPQQWPIQGSKISVTRVVTPPTQLSLPSPPNTPSLPRSGPHRNQPINILLVIARSLAFGSDDLYKDANPGLAYHAIRRAKKRLQSTTNSDHINLEVVKQGTFQEFKRHLKKRTHEKGAGYFHYVHFDVHGLVKKGTPYLQFVDEESYEDRLVPHTAHEVGRVLTEHKVPCVITNACYSAKADQGATANLSSIFAQNGVSNVVAMSYKFSTSAARIFHNSFYEALFVGNYTIAEAATHARKALRDDPERLGKNNQRFKLPDWIVPVFYTYCKDIHPMRHPTNDWVAPSNISPIRKSVLQRIFGSFPILQQRYSYRELINLEDEGLRDAEDRHTCDVQEAKGMDNILELDGDTLRLQRDMMNDHIIYLQGCNFSNKDIYLDHLEDFWLSTKIVERVFIIRPQIFVNSWPFAACERLKQYWRRDDAYISPTMGTRADDKWRDPNTIIIIDDIHELFSDRYTPRQQRRGQARLRKFLSRLPTVQESKEDEGCPWLPYLMLVGQEHPQQFMQQHFGDLELEYAYHVRTFLPSFRQLD